MSEKVAFDPLKSLATQPAISESSISVEKGLTVHYRHDLPGRLEAPETLSHHLLTFFLTRNQRQVTTINGHGEYDGEMTRGEFYLYPAGIAGRTHWHSVDKTLHFVIEPGLLRRVAMEADGICSDRVELLPNLKSRDRKIEHLAQLFLLEMGHDDAAPTLYLESLSTALCSHLLLQYCNVVLSSAPAIDGLGPRTLKQVLDYIQAHLDSDLSLVVMAKQAGISRCYFAHRFKQSMQVTPHQYVSQQRIEKAKQLLKTQQLSIAEIALACGFSSQSHLTRVFRRYTRTTPKVYQDQL